MRYARRNVFRRFAALPPVRSLDNGGQTLAFLNLAHQFVDGSGQMRRFRFDFSFQSGPQLLFEALHAQPFFQHGFHMDHPDQQ